MLEAAERWGIPPWQVEAEAPDIWMERQLLWTGAKNRRQTDHRSPVGEVRQVGGKRVKRLV